MEYLFVDLFLKDTQHSWGISGVGHTEIATNKVSLSIENKKRVTTQAFIIPGWVSYFGITRVTNKVANIPKDEEVEAWINQIKQFGYEKVIRG